MAPIPDGSLQDLRLGEFLRPARSNRASVAFRTPEIHPATRVSPCSRSHAMSRIVFYSCSIESHAPWRELALLERPSVSASNDQSRRDPARKRSRSAINGNVSAEDLGAEHVSSYEAPRKVALAVAQTQQLKLRNCR